jgi:Zn-dependent protease
VSLEPTTFVRNLALYLIPMILSLTVHEFAHALVATKLGDETPEADGRLTLSPVAHVDPVGTLLVPTISILLVGYSFIGWAKPVAFNPVRFKRNVSMRQGIAITAAAGPLSNLLLAIGSIALLTGLLHGNVLSWGNPTQASMIRFLMAMFSVNIGLCVFNFLPIPPLDGSRLLPRSFDDLVEQASRYSFLLVLVVLNIPLLRDWLITMPVRFLGNGILSIFGHPHLL